MVAIFLCLLPGSILLAFFFSDRAYGFQAVSLIAYTLFELFFTFARTGASEEAPISRPSSPHARPAKPQLPRLLWRDLGNFLVALFALQTAMLRARPLLAKIGGIRRAKRVLRLSIWP